jgi:phospholipid transport system substrate-binding protein
MAVLLSIVPDQRTYRVRLFPSLCNPDSAALSPVGWVPPPFALSCARRYAPEKPMTKMTMWRTAGLRIVASVMLACLCAGAAAAESGASDAVRHFYDALLQTMRNADSLGFKGRYQALAPVVLATFDVPFMTRLSVGPPWAKLSSDEKRRAGQAFARYITTNYASQFDGFAGERFEILGEQRIAHATMVRTRLVKPDGETVAINYALHDNDTAWQIRDVYLAGTISELATRRSDFTSTLRSGGIEALIARLNQKADDLYGK